MMIKQGRGRIYGITKHISVGFRTQCESVMITMFYSAFVLGLSFVLQVAAWNQTEFLISFWVDPVVPTSQFDAEYKTIADANFTTILGGFGATVPGAVEAQLAAASAAGLSVIASACESADGPGSEGSCVGISSNSSLLLGYQLTDEPSFEDFEMLGAWAASVSERAPGALRFINLFPNYVVQSLMGASTYGEYLESFVETVKPDIICFDAYPQFYPGSFTDTSTNFTMAGYLLNLADVRTVSLSHGLPFMNFFAAMPFQVRIVFVCIAPSR